MDKENCADTKQLIEKAYWDALLLDGKRPKSVYALCDKIGVKEADFYDYYGSLDGIESAYWSSTVSETIKVLEEDEDYAEYDFQQKILAFYYTYFTHIQGNRSRFLEVYPVHGPKVIKNLHGMRKVFIEHIDVILTQGMEEGIVMDRKVLNKHYSKGIFEQFRAITLFYRCDDSEKFQDTDAFIEKTVRVVVDGLGSGMLDSMIDVARFMMRKTPFAKES